MKIVSKFHDYYDIGASMGVDESLVFVRNFEAVNLSNSDIPFRTGYWSGLKHSRIIHIIQKNIPTRKGLFESDYSQLVNLVGFCGKLYPFICIDYFHRKTGKHIKRFHYEVSDQLVNDLVEMYDSTRLTYRPRREDDKEFLKKMYRKMEKLLSPLEDNHKLFHDLQTPVFLLAPEQGKLEHIIHGTIPPKFEKNTDRVYKNPCLKDIQFYKVVDSFTAFQEVSMFLGGVLGINQVPPVEISDVDMRDAKGFNERSFKKEPTKRKKK